MGVVGNDLGAIAEFRVESLNLIRDLLCEVPCEPHVVWSHGGSGSYREHDVQSVVTKGDILALRDGMHSPRTGSFVRGFQPLHVRQILGIGLGAGGGGGITTVPSGRGSTMEYEPGAGAAASIGGGTGSFVGSGGATTSGLARDMGSLVRGYAHEIPYEIRIYVYRAKYATTNARP